jgi:hypothetical protein
MGNKVQDNSGLAQEAGLYLWQWVSLKKWHGRPARVPGARGSYHLQTQATAHLALGAGVSGKKIVGRSAGSHLQMAFPEGLLAQRF